MNLKMSSFIYGLLLVGALFTIQADKITRQKTIRLSDQAVAEIKYDRFNERYDVVQDFKTRGHIEYDRWLDQWEYSEEE